MRQIDREANRNWNGYLENLMHETPVDKSMSKADIERHRLWLEEHPIEWIKFFFPGYAKYEFAGFQKRAVNRIITNPEWYEVLSWSRELAKSTCVISYSYPTHSTTPSVCSTPTVVISRRTDASKPTTVNSRRWAAGRTVSSY